MIELSIQITQGSERWKKAFPSMKKKIEQAAACAFLHGKKPAAFKERAFEINILLTNDANVKKLNKGYRGKDKPTNVLSFPQLETAGLKKKDLAVFPSDASIPLGDVVLAQQTIAKEAKEQGKSLESHTIHLIVHGTLHLLGYDHMTDKEAKIMEKLECDILCALGYPDPYNENVIKADKD